MSLRNITYDIPRGKLLSCIACNTAFKNVVDAIEHTVVCLKRNRLANKHEGLDQIERIRGSVRWTRTNVSHLLNLLKKKVSDLGKAKAHYGTYELGKVHEVIASELADLIGPGVTRYQVTRKWTLLQKRSMRYEAIRKKQIEAGFQSSDPPFFHPSVKEIMRCVEEEKINYLKKMEHSEKSYLLKIKEEEMKMPHELCSDKDVSFEIPEGADDEGCKISQNEGEEPGSMIIKRNTVLRIISQLEEGIPYSEIMKEFDITESVLSAIDHNREAIAEGAQRCSLCHILLSTQDDVVAHETVCCNMTQPSFKEVRGFSADGNDSFEGFLSETASQLVDIIMKWYPKFTKGVSWNKVASHLSVMQSGVTAMRCRQKWHNLIAKCRKYQRLDNWAKRHNYSHNNPPPDFYDRLIPYAESGRDFEPSQESIQRFLSIGPYTNLKSNPVTVINESKMRNESDSECEGNLSAVVNGNYDDEDCYDEEEGTGNCNSPTNRDDLVEAESEENYFHSDDIPSEQNSETSFTKLSTSRVDMDSSFLRGHNKRKKKQQRRLKTLENDGKSHMSGDSDVQAHHISKIETKLEEVVGLLSDVVKENHRLMREAEKRSREKNSQEEIAEKLENLSKIFITTHRQNLKNFQSMAKMWERHHQEHQAMMKTLISEITGKRKVEDVKGVKRKKLES